MQKHISCFFILITVLLLLGSCTDSQLKNLEPKPTAYGNQNFVVVVSDQNEKTQLATDSLLLFLQSAYPILPKPEPLYDTRLYNVNQILSAKERKELRTYVFLANLQDTLSPTTSFVVKDIGYKKLKQETKKLGFTTKVIKDRWARGQLHIYLIADNKNNLLKNVQQNFQAIHSKIKNHDNNLIKATTFFKGDNRQLETSIEDTLGIRMRIPADYIRATYDSIQNLFWIRYNPKDYQYNLLVHKLQYQTKDQLTRKGLLNIRNQLGRIVSTSVDDSYMVVNDRDLPLFITPTKINGRYALEARGIWEIENDFLGGSFISYLIHNEEKGELVYVDGFLFAPNKQKRNAMQELELILKTTQF